MSQKNKKADDIANLKKELSDLKSFICEKLSSQDKLNAELKARVETLKMIFATFSKLNNRLKFLAGKYKKQEGALELLIKLFQGKLVDYACDCGKKVKLMSTIDASNCKVKADKVKEHSDESVAVDTRSKSTEAVDVRLTATAPLPQFDHRPPPIEVMDGSQAAAAVAPLPQFYHPPIYRYTENQTLKLNRSLAGVWSMYGEVEKLDDRGMWKFKLADHSKDSWAALVQGRKVVMESRPILLFEELSGLCVMVRLRNGSLSTNNRAFRIQLFVPRCDENSGIRLPAELNVQVKMRLNDQTYRTTNCQKFRLKKFNFLLWWSEAEPDNFFLPFEGAERITLPELMFQFSK